MPQKGRKHIQKLQSILQEALETAWRGTNAPLDLGRTREAWQFTQLVRKTLNATHKRQETLLAHASDSLAGIRNELVTSPVAVSGFWIGGRMQGAKVRSESFFAVACAPGKNPIAFRYHGFDETDGGHIRRRGQGQWLTMPELTKWPLLAFNISNTTSRSLTQGFLFWALNTDVSLRQTLIQLQAK